VGFVSLKSETAKIIL